jgi:hypothetical protein
VRLEATGLRLEEEKLVLPAAIIIHPRIIERLVRSARVLPAIGF